MAEKKSRSLADVLADLNSPEAAQEELQQLKRRAERFVLRAEKSWYPALGIAPTTDVAIIRTAYVDCIKDFHSDALEGHFKNLKAKHPELAKDIQETEHALEEAAKKLNEVKNSFLHPTKGEMFRQRYFEEFGKGTNTSGVTLDDLLNSVLEGVFPHFERGTRSFEGFFNNIFGVGTSRKSPTVSTPPTHVDLRSADESSDADLAEVEMERQTILLKEKILQSTDLAETFKLLEEFVEAHPTLTEQAHSFTNPYGKTSIDTIHSLVMYHLNYPHKRTPDAFTDLELSDPTVKHILEQIEAHQEPEPNLDWLDSLGLREKNVDQPKPESSPAKTEFFNSLRLITLKNDIFAAADLDEIIEILSNFIDRYPEDKDQPIVDQPVHNSPFLLMHMLKNSKDSLDLTLEITPLSNTDDEVIKTLREKLTEHWEQLRATSAPESSERSGRLQLLRGDIIDAPNLDDIIKILSSFIARHPEDQNQPIASIFPSSANFLLHRLEVYKDSPDLTLEDTVFREKTGDEVVKTLREKLKEYWESRDTSETEESITKNFPPEAIPEPEPPLMVAEPIIEPEVVAAPPEPEPSTATPVEPEVTEPEVITPETPKPTPQPETPIIPPPEKREFDSPRMIYIRQELLKTTSLAQAQELLGKYWDEVTNQLICLEPPILFEDIFSTLYRLNAKTLQFDAATQLKEFSSQDDPVGKHLSTLAQSLS